MQLAITPLVHTYANANYILLAAIIEEVSQQDYESFLREFFWNPLPCL